MDMYVYYIFSIYVYISNKPHIYVYDIYVYICMGFMIYVCIYIVCIYAIY